MPKTRNFVLFDDTGAHPLPTQPKLQAARTLIAWIAERLPR
ncbi:Coenzyme A biosynthesis bifunctional protein CoaBC OS=Castellaniella defragrans OX=75697 GN=coaBC PE=3 SV=1 [Castellaniella defragrans]